LLKIKRR